MKRKRFLNKKTVIVLILVIVGLPVIVLCPSDIGIIPRDIGIAIVGYAGAILGGLLTLYGVKWTIEDSNANRKRELDLQYCPILTSDVVEKKEPIYNSCSELTILYSHICFSKTDTKDMNKLIKFTNVGRGEIQSVDLDIKECKAKLSYAEGYDEELNTEESYILFKGITNLIPVNGVFYLYLNLPNLMQNTSTSIWEKSRIVLDVSLEISIEGVFNVDIQKYLLHFYLWRDVNDNKGECEICSMSLNKI